MQNKKTGCIEQYAQCMGVWRKGSIHLDINTGYVDCPVLENASSYEDETIEISRLNN